MRMLIKKINKDAITPSYAHDNDAGLDLYSAENYILTPGNIVLIHTGIIVSLPPNTEAQIRPRSGLALEYGITVLNSPGTIDEGYRGEIGVILINHGKQNFMVEIGTKIAQMVIKPVLHVDIEEVINLDNTTDRGENGFGSSGIE